MESKKLYVGNLNYSVTNQDLEELFSEYGTVDSVNVIEGKGFGFVEMADAAEAEKAKKGLSESSFKGRALRVDEANPPASSDRRGPEASSSPPPPEVPTEDWSLLSEEEAKERIQKMVEDASLKETGFGARRFYFVTRENKIPFLDLSDELTGRLGAYGPAGEGPGGDRGGARGRSRRLHDRPAGCGAADANHRSRFRPLHEPAILSRFLSRPRTEKALQEIITTGSINPRSHCPAHRGLPCGSA